MEPFYLMVRPDSIYVLDESELVAICSPRRERPKSKHDHYRRYGDAFFDERGRISLIDHGDQVSNGLEKGKIGKNVRGIEKKEPADPNIVWWDDDDDPANPLNWSAWSKWMNIGIVSMMTFIM